MSIYSEITLKPGREATVDQCPNCKNTLKYYYCPCGLFSEGTQCRNTNCPKPEKVNNLAEQKNSWRKRRKRKIIPLSMNGCAKYALTRSLKQSTRPVATSQCALTVSPTCRRGKSTTRWPASSTGYLYLIFMDKQPQKLQQVLRDTMKINQKQLQINESQNIFIPLITSKVNMKKAKQRLLISEAGKFSIIKTSIDQLCDSQKQVIIVQDLEGKRFYIKIISLNTVIQHQLGEQLALNQKLLGTIDHYLFPQNFLKIQAKIQSSNSIGLVVQPYQYTLEQYARKQKLKQKEALFIFKQIMKATYSLYCEHYFNFQLRSKHFVFSKNKWKLQSLEFYKKQQNKDTNFQYLRSKNHQTPEQKPQNGVYSKKSLEQMQVWNLGCILLQMLVGYHPFSTNKRRNLLHTGKKEFILGIIDNSETKISMEIKSTLIGMLCFEPQKRLTLQQLFANDILSPLVAKLHHQEEQSAEISKRFFNDKQLHQGNAAQFMKQQRKMERKLNKPELIGPLSSNDSDSEKNKIQFQLEDPLPQEQLPFQLPFYSYKKELQQPPIKDQQKQQPIQQLSIYDETICKLCYINKSEMINQKCGHITMCQTCWKVYAKEQINDEHPCVICRTPGRYYKYIQPIFF